MAYKKNISQQAEMLNQISKVSDAIRQKYKILKIGRDSSEQAANEAFKPIVTPLKALVENSKAIKYEIKQENSQNYSIKKPEVSQYETFYDDTPQISAENSGLDQSSASMINQTIVSPFPGMTSTPIKGQDSLSQYISTLSRSKKYPRGLDTRFGIRKKGQQLFLGDSTVHLQNNTLIVKNKSIPLTPGLIELLFKSDPLERLINDDDLKVYKDLLISTNTHRKHYEADRSLYTEKSTKYNKYISKLTRSFIEGQGLPNFMTASRKRKNIDYVYWDDPNELVDRLRLLTASQVAGNTSHSIEIISIIEELREAQIVY